MIWFFVATSTHRICSTIYTKYRCYKLYIPLAADKDNVELIKRISVSIDISIESAERYLQNTITYTYGIAVLLAIGIIKASETEAMKLANRAGDAFLMQEGVPSHKIPQLGKNEK